MHANSSVLATLTSTQKQKRAALTSSKRSGSFRLCARGGSAVARRLCLRLHCSLLRSLAFIGRADCDAICEQCIRGARSEGEGSTRSRLRCSPAGL